MLLCSLQHVNPLTAFKLPYKSVSKQVQMAVKPVPQRQIKAVIFDLDGTILKTDHVWKSSNAPILDSHAPHFTKAEKDAIASTFGDMTIYEVWQKVHTVCSVEISMDEIINENIKHLHVRYEADSISFIPHFKKFHKKVAKRGLKTAIATNSQQETMDVILRKVPLKKHFGEHIYNADHVNKVFKPNPDVYLHAAKMIEVDPADCLVIEDSGSGIKAAKSAGMYCIGINTGNNRDLLHQADEIVDCFSEIDLNKFFAK